MVVKKNFTLIAANDVRTLESLTHDDLLKLGKRLRLPVVVRWPFSSTQQILDQMKYPSVKNREGYVVRYADGRFVKFKFQTYLAEMRVSRAFSFLFDASFYGWKNRRGYANVSGGDFAGSGEDACSFEKKLAGCGGILNKNESIFTIWYHRNNLLLTTEPGA